MARIDFESFFAYYEGLPHQELAVEMLENALPLELLDDRSDWVELYRSVPPEAPEAPEPTPSSLTPGSPFSQLVTEHFTYGEFCLYQEARRPTAQHQCDTILKLSRFLEEARSEFGTAIIITSGIRPEPINSQVGGAPNSEHTYYATGVGAVDVALERGDQFEFQAWVDDNWSESVGYGAPSFVHIGCRGDGLRRQWDY